MDTGRGTERGRSPFRVAEVVAAVVEALVITVGVDVGAAAWFTVIGIGIVVPSWAVTRMWIALSPTLRPMSPDRTAASNRSAVTSM